MQRTMRVERVPKLDKVLRVTFSAIKRDLAQTKNEFDQLEEKVNDSLEYYSKRLNENSQSTWIKINTKAKEIEDHFAKKTKVFEKELNHVTKTTKDFLDSTNMRVNSWNRKIERIDINALKAKEIGKNLKRIEYLSSELEKIKALSEEIETLDQIKINTADFKDTTKKLQKQINDEAGSFATSLAIADKNHRKNIDTVKKALEKRMDNNNNKFDQLVINVTGALSTMDKEMKAKNPGEKVVEELVSSKIEILKEFNSMKDSYKKEMLSKQNKINLKELKDEIKANVLRDLSRGLKGKTVVVKKVAPVEKKGLFSRFVDFLVEDVDDDKDKTIHEFDKKKGDKFEIKEIKNMK